MRFTHSHVPPSHRLPPPARRADRLPDSAEAMLPLAIALLILSASVADAFSSVPELPPPPAPPVYVIMGPDSVPIARAIVDATEACPVLMADGKMMFVTTHAEPDPDHGFPERVCSGDLPKNYSFASFGPTDLPSVESGPVNFGIIGDTGLRVKVKNNGTLPCPANLSESIVEYPGSAGVCFDYGKWNGNIQGMEQSLNPVSNPWPYQLMADELAGKNPDVIIHVGDFLYGETECPDVCPVDEEDATKGFLDPCPCANMTSHGDQWSSWQEDFFEPSRKLLLAAPWIILRGNHEICTRSGVGWFRYLDPRPMPPLQEWKWQGAKQYVPCSEFTDPYVVTYHDVQWLVVDSSQVASVGGGIDHYDGDCPTEVTVITGLDPRNESAFPYTPNSSHGFDPSNFPAEYGNYTEIFAEGKSMLDSHKPVGLLSHRPLYAITCHKGSYLALDYTLQLAAEATGLFNSTIKFVLSGHYHLFQYVEYEGRVPTLVFGHGGTKLFDGDPNIATAVGATVLTEDGAPAAVITANSTMYKQFGFGLLEVKEERFEVTEGAGAAWQRFNFTIPA